MVMPRFGIKTTLIAFAVLAVWMSTFRGFSGGRDVRAVILLAVAAASVLAALYLRGRPRAFWLGFVISIALMEMPLSPHYKLNYLWLRRILERLEMPTGATNFVYLAFLDTAYAMSTFGIAVAVGYIGTRVYDYAQHGEEHK